MSKKTRESRFYIASKTHGKLVAVRGHTESRMRCVFEDQCKNPCPANKHNGAEFIPPAPIAFSTIPAANKFLDVIAVMADCVWMYEPEGSWLCPIFVVDEKGKVVCDEPQGTSSCLEYAL